MKCPKCEVVQSDSNTECKGCGIIFAKYEEAQAAKAAITYEVVERKMPWGIVAVALIVIGGGLFFGVKSPRSRVERKPSDAAVAIPKENRTIPQAGRVNVGEHILNKACMDDALNGGLDEVQAKAMCLNDPDAKQQLKEENEEKEKLLNFTDAADIDKIELLVKAEKGNIQGEYRVRTFILPYDSDGHSAATEGDVELSMTPEIPVAIPRTVHLDKSVFRVSRVKGKEGILAWAELNLMYVNVTPELQGKTIVLTATFDGEVTARATLYIDEAALETSDAGIEERASDEE